MIKSEGVDREGIVIILTLCKNSTPYDRFIADDTFESSEAVWWFNSDLRFEKLDFVLGKKVFICFDDNRLNLEEHGRLLKHIKALILAGAEQVTTQFILEDQRVTLETENNQLVGWEEERGAK